MSDEVLAEQCGAVQVITTHHPLELVSWDFGKLATLPTR
jgi:hypothetical protein